MQFWQPAGSVFLVYLDQTEDKEVLLFSSMRIPVIWFLDSNKESRGPCTLLVQLFLGCIRNSIGEGLDHGQIVKDPGFPNRKGTIRILPRLVHAHTPRLSYSNNDDPRFLIFRRRLPWRRARGVCCILVYSNVCNVGLGN